MHRPDLDRQGLALTATLVGVVGVAAVTGGAFAPGARAVLTALLAVGLGAAALRQWTPRPEDVGFMALVGWGAVAAAVRGLEPLAAKEVLTAWVVAWALWAAVRDVDDRTRGDGLVVLGATAGLLCLGLVAEFVGLRSPRVGGMLENPNVAAALVLPTAAALACARDGRTSPARLLVAGGLLVGVALTGSRAALLAALAATAVMLPRGKVRAWVTVAGAGLVLVGVGWRLSQVPDPLAWHRLEIWKAGLRLVASHPVAGVGPGGLAGAAGVVRIPHDDLFGVHQRIIGGAESTPLGLLAAVGGVGALVVIVMAWRWLRSARAAGLVASPRTRGAVAAMLTFALFHDLTAVEVNLWWWALLLGLLGGAPGPASRPVLRSARPVIAAVLVWVVLWGLTQPAHARWLWSTRGPSTGLAEQLLVAEPWLSRPAEWSAAELLGRPRWTWREAAQALAWAERAVAAEPGRARLWAVLGRVHARTIGELGWSEASALAGRQAFSRATELEPWLPWYWAEHAELERRLGRLEAALALARRAVAVEPRFVGGHLLLARLELDLGEVEAARASFRAALEIRASARHRRLTSYERGLAVPPPWQVELLSGELQ